MSSEGPESTDIDLEQAQQESASILNVLRAPMSAEFVHVESENYYGVYQCFSIFSCFDSYNVCPLANH